MIRDDVLILLNEREPLKLQMAAQLQQLLQEKQLVAERLEPGPHLVPAIIERSPSVLVLDYLLADYGTALEILQALCDSLDIIIPTILWTDEPSIYAAVNALKLGAVDYIKIDSPRSLQQVIQCIEACLASRPAPEVSSMGELFPAPLVYEARSARLSLALAHSAARQNKRIVVLLGPSGVGRNSLGRYMHRQRQRPGVLTEIDFSIWPYDVSRIFGSDNQRVNIPLLAHSASVIIVHMESDTGELLEAAGPFASHVASSLITDAMLILGTTCKETARTWHRVLGADIIEIPSLGERCEDIIPLLCQLKSEACRLNPEKIPDFDAVVIKALSEMNWPGNIRQFRASLLDALSMPRQLLQCMVQEDARNLPQEYAVLKENFSLDHNQGILLASVALAKERWHRFSFLESCVPQPLLARRVLEESGGSLRIASGRLGTSVSQLRKALSFTPGVSHE